MQKVEQVRIDAAKSGLLQQFEVGVVCWKNELPLQSASGSGEVLALDRDTACSKAIELFKQKCDEKDGWFLHQVVCCVSGKEIGSGIVEKKLQEFRMGMTIAQIDDVPSDEFKHLKELIRQSKQTPTLPASLPASLSPVDIALQYLAAREKI